MYVIHLYKYINKFNRYFAVCAFVEQWLIRWYRTERFQHMIDDENHTYFVFWFSFYFNVCEVQRLSLLFSIVQTYLCSFHGLWKNGKTKLKRAHTLECFVIKKKHIQIKSLQEICSMFMRRVGSNIKFCLQKSLFYANMNISYNILSIMNWSEYQQNIQADCDSKLNIYVQIFIFLPGDSLPSSISPSKIVLFDTKFNSASNTTDIEVSMSYWERPTRPAPKPVAEKF